MQFIDKAVNRVIKWESIDVTIPEMIDLVQTEIIEKASEKDLVELEKGMQKTFVLGVGYGRKWRYYPSSLAEFYLCVEYNSLTHQLYKISLRDSTNKKEFFIPTGKASCTRLQSGVLRRIAQYKHGATGATQKAGDEGHRPIKTPERQEAVLYCKYCGERLEPGSAFCVKCGKPLRPQNNPAGGQNRPQAPREDNRSKPFGKEESFTYESRRPAPRSSSKGGKFAQKRSSPRAPILRIVGVIALCTVLVVGAFALIGNLGEPSTKKNIKTVQNGYLGEFTNLTVKEILDNSCGMMYEDSVWDGGETDSGKKIVQVKFFNESFETDPMVIQFTMLDRDCFKITSYVDPISPIEKSTDLFAEMNWNYLTAYLGQDETIVGNKAKEYSFFQHLDQISGSAVQYGAAANYHGDRAKLCELDNEKPLEVSVAMLIDNYGLMDMSYYLDPGAMNQSFGTDISEPEESEDSLTDNSPTEGTVANVMDNSEHLPGQYTTEQLKWWLKQNTLSAQRELLDQNIELCGRLQYADVDYFLLGAIDDYEDRDTIRCRFTNDAQRDFIATKYANDYIGEVIVLQCHVAEVDGQNGYTVDVLDIGNYTENIYTGPPSAYTKFLQTSEPYEDAFTGNFAIAHIDADRAFTICGGSSGGYVTYWLVFEREHLWQFNPSTGIAMDETALVCLPSKGTEHNGNTTTIHFDGSNLPQMYPGKADFTAYYDEDIADFTFHGNFQVPRITEGDYDIVRIWLYDEY